MIGKLPKSEAWKQSDPDRPGLLLHPRYWSRDSLSESRGFWQSFRTRATRRSLDWPEALLPLEPHDSPDKATPSYYTKNESFGSGISM
jgi:hypothetical protein